ncbi:MAG TPA: metallophosphoesterase [Candidatus Acidoferrum sp.]|nr:metallophosphoesterase [Candidatus Acidoferrum sp.]
MTRVLVFSDIHGDYRSLERIASQPADVYIAAGDLSNFGRGLDRCGEILHPLGQRLWVLPGNHESHAETKDFCARFGFFDFHRQARTLDGASGPVHWAGLGYSNITPFKTPGEYTEEEISAALAAFDGLSPLYLVVHFPPFGTRLDEYAPGKHAGSPALRSWVEAHHPARLFCGHIHETAGLSEQFGTTDCRNVGKQGLPVEI